MAGRTIFRETALEAHRRGAKKDILPRLTSWPIIVCSWLLLGALVATALLLWSVRVPTYVAASGVIFRPGEQFGPTCGETAAVLFVPPDQSGHLRVGQPIHGQIGSSARYVQGDIALIEPGVIGPDTARERYQFDGGSDIITQPSIVLLVRLGKALPSDAYAGSRLTAQIEIGSQPLRALFPALGTLLGGGS
jgi:hypothetical protein